MELNEDLDTVLNDIQLAVSNLVQADAALRGGLIDAAHSALENVQSIIAEAIEIVEEL